MTCAFISKGQPYVNEALFLSTDRNYYVCGEDIRFSAFLPQGLSSVIYIEFYNEENAFVQKSVLVENNFCYGKLSIPEDIPSGDYAIRAYTWHQQNHSHNTFASVPLTVMNPDYGIPEYANLPSVPNSKHSAAITITTDKSGYSNREKVVFSVKTNALSNDSIIAANLVVVKKGFTNTTYSLSGSSIADSENHYFHFPEISGPVLHGFVRGEKRNNRIIYLAKTGKNCYFRIGVSDSTGLFNIPYDPFNNKQTMFINTNNNIGIDSIVLVNNFCNTYNKIKQNKPLSRESWLDLIRNKSVKTEYYHNKQNQPVIERKTLHIPGDPAYSVCTEDYIELSSLKEIFQEIVPYVKIREKDSKPSLAVLDDRRDILYSNPVVFLDNLPIHDIAELFTIHPGKIDSIAVINRPYVYGSLVLDGIIQIYTNTDNAGGYNFKLPAMFFLNPATEKIMGTKNADYSFNQKKNSPLPDFRTVLYTKPVLEITKGTASGSFYTSDDTGEYEITITYMTKQGHTGHTKSLFTVK